MALKVVIEEKVFFCGIDNMHVYILLKMLYSYEEFKTLFEDHNLNGCA